MLKCSNFYCLHITTYASKIKYRDNTEWSKQTTILYNNYLDFKSEFLLKTLGKDLNFFHANYGCFTNESIKEFLEVWHNIRISDHEGYYQILIPSQYRELIRWVNENKPNHSKVLIRYRLGLMNIVPQKTEFYFTHQAHEFSLKIREKYFDKLDAIEELENTIRLS